MSKAIWITRIGFYSALFVFLLFFLLMLAIPEGDRAVASSGCGWVNQTPIPEGEDLYSVDAVNGDLAWAAGTGGTILKTTDGGESWTQQDPGIAGSNVYINYVSAVDEKTVWAGGYNSADSAAVLLKTIDGGTNWIPQESALAAFRSPRNLVLAVSGLCALDYDTVWVAINYTSTGTAPFGLSHDASIWRSDNGGASWTMKLNTTCPARINEVYAVDDQVAWAAGGSTFLYPYPAVFVTSNGGSTWQYRYLDFFGNPKYRMLDVWASDAFNAWAAYGPVGAMEGGVKRTCDGGTTWATQPSEAGVYPNALSAVDINTLWVVGTSGKIYKTIDGGATWIIQDSGLTNDLNDVCAVDIDTAWAVGDNGVILKTENGGGGPPSIYSVQPSSASAGTAVTVSGCSFGNTQDSSYVSFGVTQATTYTSWSDTEIVVGVPAGVEGEVEVTVTTCEGTSNPADFTAYAEPGITSVTPDTAAQNAVTVEITDLAGAGFMPGATVRFEQGDIALNAYDVNVVSADSITCKIGFFLQPPGAWDVVVENPDGAEARLGDAFTVTSACGEGSGTAMLMLGLTLGLLSLAGSKRLRRRRK